MKVFFMLFLAGFMVVVKTQKKIALLQHEKNEQIALLNSYHKTMQDMIKTQEKIDDSLKVFKQVVDISRIEEFTSLTGDVNAWSDVLKVAIKWDVSPDCIMQIMKNESGFQPEAKNPYSSATGLWQATNTTMRELGYKHPLKKYDVKKQLQILDQYFEYFKCPSGSCSTLKAAIFLPARRNFDLLISKNHYFWMYETNKVYDINKDFKIYKHEIMNK